MSLNQDSCKVIRVADDEYFYTALWVSIIALTVTLVLSRAIAVFVDHQYSDVKQARAWQLMAITLVLFIGFGIISWFIYRQRIGPDANFGHWLNGDPLNFNTIWVGFFANVVFGFIDNFGLFFGANFLDEWFMQLPASDDANVFAGQGNTYSDLLGTFMSTFMGAVVYDLTRVASTPIWGDAVGIVLGCLIGIVVPKLMLGTVSETHGLNRCTAKSAFLGDLDQEALENLVNKDLTLLQFRARVVFSMLDENRSGTLDVDEIKSHLERAMGDEQDESVFLEQIAKQFNFDLEGTTKEFNIDEFEMIQREMAITLYNDKFVKEGAPELNFDDAGKVIVPSN